MAAHRYWRLAITANHAAANGSGIVSAEEIEFRASAGGADLTGSGTAIGSGTPANAFDNNTSTIWFNENGHNGPELFEFSTPDHVSFVGYDFGAGSPVDVREIYYESQVGQPGREPRHMLVQFSDDNATWITAETFWNIPAWSNGEARTFTVPEWTAFPTHARRYWRIQLIDTFDSTYGALSRVDFLDKANGSWLSFNGTASAGNTAGGSAADAFNGYPGNYWTGNKDTWVQYAFSAGVKWDFVGVRLRGLSGFASRSPKSFKIQDSDDGATWRDRLTVTGEPSWSDGEMRTYTIDPLPASGFIGQSDRSDYNNSSSWVHHFSAPPAGALLILYTARNGTANVPTITGWTLLDAFFGAPSIRAYVFYKVATGSETSVTIPWSVAGSGVSRVQVWVDVVAPPTYAYLENGVQVSSCDPPSHTAPGPRHEWIVFRAGRIANNATPGVLPNYTAHDYKDNDLGDSASITTFRRTLTATTENPPVFTIGSDSNVVLTIALESSVSPTELEIAASLPALAASVSLDAGIPAPEAVTVNHPSQTQNVPFNVNWTAVTGADSYEVKYSKGGAAQVMLSAAAVGTSVVFSPTQTGTFVFYVRTNIDGEYSEQTASVTVTVAKQGKATFGKITILTAGTGNLSGEVTPDGTVRGVVVGIVQSLTPGGSVDEVSGVTYGGVAMQEVTALAHDHSEDGRIYLYFLGSGIPAGAQTVEVTASGTTAEKVAFIFTVHAGADTELHAFDTLSSGSVANPSDTLLLNGRTSFVGLFGFAGRDAVVNTAPLAGWTDSAEADQGSSVALAYRYLTVDGVDVTYGWTQAADDAAAIAFAVSAVGSAASAGGTGTGRIDGIDVIDQIGRI